MKIIKALSAPNIYLAVAVIWTLLILFVCMFSFKKFPSLEIGGGDKYGHVVLHFGFTFFWFLYYDTKPKTQRLVLKIVIASVLFGIAIEIMQGLFTATRKADIFDVLANTVGAIGAGVFIYLSNKIRKRRFSN